MGMTFKPGSSPIDVALKYKAATDRAKNLGPVLKAVATAIKKLMDEAFSSKVSPDGKPWAPNKPSTLQHKRGSLGIETGKLVNSLYATVEGNIIRYGASTNYASAFNYGSSRLGSLANDAYMGGVKRPRGSAFTTIVPGRAFQPTFTGGASKALRLLINKWIADYIATGKLP